MAALERLVAHDLFLQFLEDRLRVGLRRSTSSSGMLGDEVGQHLIDRAVVLELVLDAHRLGERHVDLLFDLAVEVVADFLLRDLDLLLAGLAAPARRSRR